MSQTRVRYGRAFLAFMTVLLLFSTVGSFVLVTEQRHSLLREWRGHLHKELNLVSSLVREALLRHNYQTVELFLDNWANERSDICELKAIAPNDFTLVHYVRSETSPYPYAEVHPVIYDGRTLLTLELVWDFSTIVGTQDELRNKLIAGSILFVLLLGVFLWSTVRRWALLPMERLQAELNEHRDHLEQLVSERTAKLTAANTQLQQEIAERRQAQKELSSVRQYLKNMIDFMPSGLIGVDANGHVTEWNASMERTSGVPAAQAIGEGFAEMFPQLESQREKISDVIRNRIPVRSERLIVTGKKEPQYIDVMLYPVITDGSVGAVIRVDDVTRRVRVEQMMVQTEKMLSVGGLAAGMAHEINNPLSGILQSCQNIERRLAPELSTNIQVAQSLGVELETINRYLEARGILTFVAEIREAGVRSARIVADMLAFSRRSTAQFEPVAIDELLETVIRLASTDYDLEKGYDFKQIEIVRDYEEGMKWVSCDRTEIEQVLMNLIRNAAHAMSTSASPPRCLTLRTRTEGDCARIEVEDNGPGMDIDTQRRVFEPFFTTKQAGMGTGLGLSVSYFIITEQHRGTISVSSTPGQGTLFVVLLPFEPWTMSPS